MTSSPPIVAVLRYYGHEACGGKAVEGLHIRHIVGNRKTARRRDVDRAEMQIVAVCRDV